MQNKSIISIIGYSGHAYVCIETAQFSGVEITGYYELNEQASNPFNLSYLGSESNINSLEHPTFIAIGNNSIREKIYAKLKDKATFQSLVHPKSIVSETAQIQDNVLISAGAVINALANIETGVIINTSAIIEHECTVNAFAHIAPGAVLTGNVKIGERSFIGANAVVKQGVTIGKDVIVGAGTVVLQNIPDHSTVVGNPGKIIKINL